MTEILPKNPSQLNTILLWVTLGCLAFVGGTSISNMRSLATIEGSQVTRPEIETKILEIKTTQITQAIDIVNLRLKVQALEAKAITP